MSADAVTSTSSLIPSSDGEDEFVTITEQYIRDSIVHTLTVWPKLSPSMLQVGIGTAVSPRMWHPILERLEASGTVVREQIRARAPSGRDRLHTVLKLGTTK